MREDTNRRKKASQFLRKIDGGQWLAGRVVEIVAQGKRGLDGLVVELGKKVAEAIMYMEREEIAGPDYRPYNSEVRKWASQPGSVFVGDRKLRIEHPRLRGPQGEIELKTYRRLRERSGFSEELLGKALRGLSGRRYHETLVEAAQAFGVSSSSVSRHLVEVSSEKLRQFRERSLKGFQPFAVFLDTIHRGGEAFMWLGARSQGE